MKQFYLILSFLLTSTFSSFSQTFDWETASGVVNGVNQTVSGITATYTTSSGTASFSDDYDGFAGSSGVIVFPTNSQNTSASVSFSQPVNIATIFAFDADGQGGSDWTFTPIGGSNSNVVQSISNQTGSTVTVNWENVTSFTITSSLGDEAYGLDDIVLSSTLSINDFTTTNVKIYPNPSSQFIQISNLNSKESYTIFSILGNEIKNGVISDNGQIDIRNFTNGLYFLKFENGNTIKFIKE